MPVILLSRGGEFVREQMMVPPLLGMPNKQARRLLSWRVRATTV
jgi:hypothetical protein